MVFSLVIGYVPVVDAAAEATVEITYGKVPTVTVTRTQEEVPVEPAPGEGEDVPATSEGEDVPATSEGDEAAPGAGGAPVPETTYQYTYTVAVTAGGESVEADEIKWTGYDDVTGNLLEDVDAASATVTVTYNGMVVSVTSSEGVDATATWAGVTAGTLATVYEGVYVDMPESKVSNVANAVNEVPVEVKQICTVDGVEIADSYANTKTAGDTLTVTEQITINGVDVATVTYEASVEATPVPVVELSADPAANENGWNNSNVTVTVSANDLGFVSGDYLPDVTNSNGDVVGAWELQADGTWTNKVTVTATDTISCNGEPVEVKIDKVIPTLDGSDTSYSFTGQKYLFVEYSVGASGLASVKVGDKVYTEWTEGNGGIWIKVNKSVNKNTKVVLTSKAGLSSGDTAIKDAGEMTVAFAHTSIVDKGNTAYVGSNPVTVTIQNIPTDTYFGLDTARTQVTATVNGVPNQVIASEWTVAGTNATASFTVPENATYTNVTATVYRTHSNWAELQKTSDKTYVNDATAPVLNVTGNVAADAAYYAGEAKYTFAVTDEHLNLGVGSANLTLNYTVLNNGTEELKSVQASEWKQMGITYTVTITIDDAQLISYEVSAKDNVGNVLTLADGALTTEAGAAEGTFVYNGPKVICDDTAPAATVTFSENVTAIYGREGKVYLWLDAPVTEENAVEVDVTATVTITDRNLTALEGWTGEIKVNEDATLTYTKTITVKPDETGVLDLNLTVADLLGNDLKAVEVAEVNGTSYPFAIAVEAGQFNLSFNVDRRRPTSTEGEEGAVDTKLPVISVIDNVTPAYTTEDGLEIFNQIPSFTFSVNDGTADSGNSGLAMVKWSLADEKGYVNENSETKTFSSEEAAVYSDTINVPVGVNGTNESNDVTLTITVVDAAGNAITHVKKFGVDTKGPQINVAYDNNEIAENAASNLYFQDSRTATIAASDINYDGMTVNGTVVTDLNTSVAYTTEGEHTLIISGEDLVKNPADVIYAEGTVSPEHFYIDLNAPKIDVAVTGATTAVNSDEKANYYNGEITYTFTVTDMFIVEGGVTAEVKYEDGTSDTIEMTLTTGENETDMDTYTGSITLKDGQVVTDIVLNALDKSGRTSQWSHTANENEKKIVVDTTAPVVTVTKTSGNFVQTYKDVDYYNAEIVYTVNVTDKFLNGNVGTAQLVVSFADGVDSVIDMANGIMLVTEDEDDSAALLGEIDEYEIEIPVADGATVTGITLRVIDNAGNVTTKVDVTDADNNEEQTLTAFNYNEGEKTLNYTGNPIVVDTVAPTATMTFSDNVDSFFIKNNTVYVVLTNPTEGESGVASTQAAEAVTVTINVQDMNLAIDNDNVNGVWAKTFGWAGETFVNGETELTYTATTGSIGADNTATFEIDVKVSDLAGNVLTAFDSEVTQDTTSFLPVEVDEEGAFEYIISLDRRRPTSENDDTTAPTITITEQNITPTKTADGLDLFNNAFKFALNVNDGEESNKNSGLKYVKWTIEDPNGVVAASAVDNAYAVEDDQVFSADYDIDIALGSAEVMESNEVTLNIIAEDNVGNQITFQKIFGVDVEAPRVEITQSNQNVQNDFYFNDDQIITVEITELNFDPANSSVTTEVPFGGWQNVGENVYRGILTYNTDGDYTFAMATTDLANNEATIDYTTGLVALEKFTIDKTAPVIHVNFNPFVPVDTDGNLVQYFNDVRTVTVTIEEHNFDADDVDADLGNANALGAWTSNGDNHTASEMFTEGNNYQVNVNYTDLAGNPATPYTSPTFSVDLTAPEIVMNKGSLTTGSLNIVPDDLLLGFAITDNQDNLKDFDVEVVFLNNGYQQTKVEGAEYYTVTEGDRTTGYIDFTNIASDKANDGIYTVRVSAIDYAGHQVYFPDVVFSLNRFGSTFTVSDGYTSDFLTTDASGVIYQSEVRNPLVVTEINPNRVWQDSDHSVEGSVITVAANGTSVTLVSGTDYDVSVTEMGNGNSKWYEYTYTINPEVFHNNQELVDGEYTIFFYSEDEAGNKNTNESNVGSALLQNPDGEYSGKITFTLDHMSPVVTILNIEEGGQYVEANRNVEINVSDNTPVSIAVYINDVLVEFVESADGQPLTSDWLTYDPLTGNYVLNMSEKDEVQNVRVVVTDAAGNVYEQTVGDITLTENLWIQFINNQALVIGSIVGLIGLIILIILLLKKRKKEEDENQNAAV